MIAYRGPGKYIQGKGVLGKLPEYATKYGGSQFILMDLVLNKKYGDFIKNSYAEKNIKAGFEIFNGENTYSEIERCQKIVMEEKYECIAAIGGG